MTNLMRALLALGLSSLATLALGQSCNPAEPRTDPGAGFSAFATLERLEVRGGRPGNQDWEWGLGTNTQQTGSFVKSYLDWVSGRVLTYTLSYNGAGAGTFTVYDGATQLATQTWNEPAKPLRTGNALKFYVKSSADSGTATVQATVATINGLPASGSIQTAGNSQFSDATMYWYFPSMAGGFTVTGSVTLTFPGTNPPQGSRLNFIVTAGSITCQQASAPPGMYFIHADHLNTPRLIANDQQQVVWRHDNTEPFGDSPPDENPSSLGTFEFPLGFAGQYRDKETGNSDNWFRTYSATLGRYSQSDLIGLVGGLNTYLYVDANPLSHSDPTGLIKPAPSTQRLPPRNCNELELAECRRQCGSRGVEKCYVRMSMQIIGVTGEGKRRYGVKEEVICSCNCPEEEKTIFERFFDWLTQPQPRPQPDPFDDRPARGRGSNPTGIPGFGPAPVFVP